MSFDDLDNKLFPRRRFIQAAGVSAAFFLPILRSFRVNAAEVGPRNLIFFLNYNGTRPEYYDIKNGSGTNFELSYILKPLERHKKNIVVVQGMTTKGRADRTHEVGSTALLTGQDHTSDDNYLALGPSLDYLLSKHLNTPLLLQRAYPKSDDWRGTFTLRGAQDLLFGDVNPKDTFDSLFGGTIAQGVDPQQIIAEKMALINYAKTGFQSLKKELSQSEKSKISDALDSVNDLEKKVRDLADVGQDLSCEKPKVPADRPSRQSRTKEAFQEVLRAQMEIMAAAMACGLRRISTLSIGGSGANNMINWKPFLGSSYGGYHAISHLEAGDSDKIKMANIERWFATEFAYFLDRLSSYSYGGHSLLSQSLVVRSNQLSESNKHMVTNVPLVLAGQADGALKTGRLVNFKEFYNTSLLAKLGEMYGMDMSNFGKKEWRRSSSVVDPIFKV